MPTPAEQKALTFVAIVILLGGAVRVLRAGPSTPTELEQQALARQATAADSASARSKATKGKHASRTAATPHVVAGVASVSPSYAPDQPFSTSPYGFPPPGPRIDTDSRGLPPQAAVARKPTGKGTPGARVDLDVATAKEIEALPRVGPALAQRIVANRDSFGAFKSIEGLRRVKGVGVATIKLFEPIVSFSGKNAPPARPY